jgi:hypothetical protein
VSAVAGEMDALRISLGEVDVLTKLTASTYDAADWGDADPAVVDAVATLLGLIEKSASGALAAFHRLHGAVADAQPAPAGERWDHEGKGTAPGGGPVLPAEDAAIVRRIREMCPDGRYDGGSDAELIELFKRNRQVLERSDEDVIAAMTHPR